MDKNRRPSEAVDKEEDGKGWPIELGAIGAVVGLAWIGVIFLFA